MTLFVDTSGILALVDQDDPAHAHVIDAFARGLVEPLVTHAYVVVETLAVARGRFGATVVADIIDRVLPGIAVMPVEASLHLAALSAFRDSLPSSVSLVDRTSVAFMHREGLGRVIALDQDFQDAGFETIP